MIKWFIKSGMFMQGAVFVMMLAALWIPAFIHPLAPVTSKLDGPFYEFIAKWTATVPGMGAAIAVILILVQSLLMYGICQAKSFFGRQNFLPAIVVMLSYSWNDSYLTLHPMLFSGVFVLITVQALLSILEKQAAYQEMFIAAFCIAIAALFFIPLTYFILFLWLTLITYRTFFWREFTISVIGFSVPFVYYASWLIWFDGFTVGAERFINSLFQWVLPASVELDNTIWLIASTFIAFITVVSVLNTMNDKTINVRRRAWVFFNLAFVSLIAIGLTGWPIISANYLFVVPMAFFITGGIAFVKRSFLTDILLVAYFLLFVLLQVYNALLLPLLA